MEVCAATEWSIGLPAALALGVGAGLVALTVWIVRENRFPGRDWFVGVVGAMIWWLGAAAFELAAVEPGCKLFGASLAWPGIVLAPTLWAGFLSRYVTSSEERLSARYLPRILLVPALAFAAAIANPFHGLLYGPGTGPVSADPGAPLVYDHGPLFFALAAYLYVFLAFGLWIVGRAALSAAGRHRRHFRAFLAITSAPVLANLAYILGGVTLFGFDPTPFSFAVTLALFAWLIVGAGLFDLVPIANRRLLAMLPDPVIVVDGAGRVVSANPAALALAGLTSEPVGARLADLPVVGDALAARLAATGSAVEGGVVATAEPRRSFDLQVVDVGRADGAGPPLGRMLYLRDVTRQEEIADHLRRSLSVSEERLATITHLHRRMQRQASRDPLTDLHNRRHLEDYLRSEADRRGRGPLRAAFAMIDLDGFKALNDRHGHPAGDDVLRDFARRLQAAVETGEGAFRLGGEEFLLVFPEADAARAAARIEALRLDFSRTPVATRAGPLSVTFSAGLAVGPRDGVDGEALMQAADRRLYAAKRAGRDRVVSGDGPSGLSATG